MRRASATSATGEESQEPKARVEPLERRVRDREEQREKGEGGERA